MPISLPKVVRILTQSEYHELNHQVLDVVFRIHNEYGWLCDEAVYKGAIAESWSRVGRVEREVPLHFTHKGFSKTYYLDLLFEDGLMLEAKTVDRLNDTHRAQALNYLLAAGMHHGTLVNLRNARVKHQFVSTRLTPEARRDIRIRAENWRHGAAAGRLADCAEALLRDWGAYLEVSLYREAIAYLLHLGEPVPVDIYGNGSVVGRQRMFLLPEDAALACTALRKNLDAMDDQFRKLLRHTKLRFIHWLNFNQNTLELTTITKP